MALTIGELVGFIRADDSGMRRGLTSAGHLMRGFQRDTEGRLRDLHGRFVTQGQAAGRSFADGLRRQARLAAPAIRAVGLAVAAVGVGLPAVAAVTAALGGIAAGAAAAGIAVKAFTLASGQQWESVKNVAKLAEDAQKAAASGAKDAADKQKAYTDALKELPSATQQTAKAFVGLKGDFKKWSDGLSGTTMPVFTKGIQIIRDLLPTLTPFVKAAASAFSGFLDDIGRGVKSAGFKEWAADMAAAAGPALSNFLKTIKNLAVGFGGLLAAFLPVSGDMTGGLADMTKAFADWGTSLGDSAGFAVFMDLAREGGKTLGTFAMAALDLLSALSPLIGVTAQIAVWVAQFINAMPPDVLLAIGTAWAAISLGIRAYGLYTTIAAAATRAWAVAQAIFNAVMNANPIGLVIAAIVALVAIIVIAYQKNETFRKIVQDVWKAVQAAVSVAIEGIKIAVLWFSKLPGMISGWFGAAKDWAIRKFLELLVWLTGLPGRARSALSGLAGALGRRVAEAGLQMVSSIRNGLNDAVAWIKGLPGRAKSALGSIGGVLWKAGQSLLRGFIDGIASMFGSVKSTLGGLTDSLTDWKGPEDVDKKLLTPAGRLVIRGFQAGIDDQVPALRAQLQGLTRGLPGIALPDYALAGAGMGAFSGGSTTPQQQRVKVEIKVDGPEPMKRLIRGIVAEDGGGDVQATFGRGRG
ncbi:phage tail protein [Streptomyces sp. NBC_01236]|uniref:phage tail protein n=1 Tax=Streptomyces sp. NBC_01236 TaxID=2903789 RepID=UPI002E162DF2|nr:hypothetical protein OG324_29335 [Streptomyces sp. NBC_01236]